MDSVEFVLDRNFGAEMKIHFVFMRLLNDIWKQKDHVRVLLKLKFDHESRLQVV